MFDNYWVKSIKIKFFKNEKLINKVKDNWIKDLN